MDLNVQVAWKMGFTGKGVVTCILDDGIDHTHPDLIDNYVSESSIKIKVSQPYSVTFRNHKTFTVSFLLPDSNEITHVVILHDNIASYSLI